MPKYEDRVKINFIEGQFGWKSLINLRLAGNGLEIRLGKRYEMEENAKKESIKDKIGSVIGWVIGGAFGYYTGIMFIIPAALAFLCGWIAYKFIKSPLSKNIIPAFVVQMGQALGMLLVVLAGYSALLFEPLLFIAVLLWMLLRPNLFNIILLIFYHLLGLIDNIPKFFSFPIGTPENKGILVHIIFRATGVFLMFWGLREVRKQKSLKNIIQ